LTPPEIGIERGKIGTTSPNVTIPPKYNSGEKRENSYPVVGKNPKDPYRGKRAY